MMDKVLEKTRELGQALLESEVYQAMKSKEMVAMQNPEVAKLMGEFMEKRTALQAMMQSENPDPIAMKKVSDEMDDTQDKLVMIDEVMEMTRARDEFNGLMGQINQLLQFIVTGQTDDGNCTGNCSSCHGCH